MKTPDIIEWQFEDDEIYCIVNACFIRGEPERWNGMTGVGNPETPDAVDFSEIYLRGDPEQTNLLPKCPRPGDKLYHFHAALEAYLFEHFTGDRHESRY